MSVSMNQAASPQLCVGAVAIDDDRILLVRRGHGPAAGEWSVPGGRVQAGETLAEAVVRELYEETALEAVCDRLLGPVEILNEDTHYVILDFVVDVLDPTIDPTAGDDAAEARWVPFWELSDYRIVDGLVDFLEEHGLLAAPSTLEDVVATTNVPGLLS